MKKEDLIQNGIPEANADKAVDLIAKGLPEDIALFVASKERNNRALNQESMELGDKITVVGFADKCSSQVIDGKLRKWVDVTTTGDRQSVSISRLVGTSKRNKYFDTEKRTGVTEDGEPLVELTELTGRTLLTLPNRELSALEYILDNCINKTYECVGIARECGQYNQTFYLFAEV